MSPANLATVSGKITMAYQGELPWHKLGTRMVGNPDVYAALDAANLNWKVDVEPTFLKDGTEVPNRRAVVRDVDRAVLGSVGLDYKVRQNIDAFMVLQPACEKLGVIIDTAGALGDGARVWMLAKMPDTIDVVTGDCIEGYLLIVTGHNGWTPYTARLTPVRVVCGNTYAVAIKGGNVLVRLRHANNRSEPTLDEVAALITKMTASLKAQKQTYGKMAKRKMTEAQIKDYVDEVLQLEERDPKQPSQLEKRADTIIQLAKTGKGVEFAPKTLWVAFNAVTEYVDHVRPAEVKSARLVTSANTSALFGPNAQLKQRAFEIAEKMAA